jgi:beta-glucosidase
VTSKRDLHETYLPAFEASFREGQAGSVMGAYNAYNGDPCCASNLLLRDILRGDWAFKGYVVSDCWAISDIYTGHKITEDKALACAMAVKAGCDLTCGEEYVNLKPAVEKGYITEKEIDVSVSRLFMARMRLGFFDAPSVVPYSKIQPTDYDKAETKAFSRVVAQKSIVLLKNEGLLPLSKAKLNKVAVIGPYINREDILLASYHGIPSASVNFLQGIISALGKEKVLFSEGVVPWDNRPDKRSHPYDLSHHSEADLSHKKQLHDEALAIAQKSEIIIAYMGISSNLESEETNLHTEGFEKGDRTTLDLPKEQQALLKDLKATGKPIVLVLTSGSALTINWEKQNIPAIVEAWYPGEEGGNAVADVLFGDYNPAGRLPITFYQSLSDLPAFENYNMQNRTYRYFTGKPLFPFGYGLSYTRFRYSDLKITKAKINTSDSIELSVTVKNTGKYDGDEVVQLYVKNLSSKQPQPIKSLKGFKRICLKKGESKTVLLPLKAGDLKYFDEDKNDFIIEPGDYEIQVGASSDDIRVRARFKIE